MSSLRSLLCAACLACALWAPADADARNIDRFLSGSWYNQAQDGHGFSIEVLANGVVVIYWYTYHPDGTPLFILAVGQAVGMSVTATAYYNTGMRFGVFDPSERMESEWGTITITFHDCNSATVEYDSTFVHNGAQFGSGSFSIQKLVSIDQLECQNDYRAGIYEGLLYSSIEDRSYYAFVLIAPGGHFVAHSDIGSLAQGTLSLNGNSFNAPGTAVSLDPDDPFSGTFTAVGELSQQYRLFTIYEVSGGDEGYGNFWASPMLYRRMTTLSGLAGTYDVGNVITGFGGTATIMNNGNIAGSDELGCQYTGNITIPDTRFNLFEVSITVSSCPGYNSTYTGLGTAIDWFEFHDSAALRVVVTDGTFGFALLAIR